MQALQMQVPPPQPMGGAGNPVSMNNRFSTRYINPEKQQMMQQPMQQQQQQQQRPYMGYPPMRPYPRPGPEMEFDGKRLRKSVMRKTVDYNSSIIKMLEGRIWQRDYRDRPAIQPDPLYVPEMLPPPALLQNPMNAVTTRFVKTATNKMRCPIFCLAWTPEGRRLVTGASSGEFTLWNGLTFNFETILQAHDSPVRTMVWSHNDLWMVTGDHSGYIKYWQSNMNNVKMYQAHKEAIRGLSFSPTDQKFATCSDDGTVRIWDFFRCFEERILRGHGADVRCVDWHPQKGLLVSGSKDHQQPVKIWDPKSGQSLATLHAHKSTVMDTKWNRNGNWLATASRDHLLKLFDIRNLSQEIQTFRGHKKEASSIAWHPVHEGLFCSGGSDGSVLFWHVGTDKEVGVIEQAHDSIVWSLAWHPLGHILCSGSNDHTSKFWTRNRPGDKMRDKYNLNLLPAGMSDRDDVDVDDTSLAIPGMGPDDKVTDSRGDVDESEIPGLDFEMPVDNKPSKKVPYAKPIPKNFQAQWNDTKKDDDDDESRKWKSHRDKEEEMLNIEAAIKSGQPPPGVVPLTELQPTAIIVGGKVLPVLPGSDLAQAIVDGADSLQKVLEEKGLKEEEPVIDTKDLEDYDEEEEDEENQQEWDNGSQDRNFAPMVKRYGDGGDVDMRGFYGARDSHNHNVGPPPGLLPRPNFPPGPPHPRFPMDNRWGPPMPPPPRPDGYYDQQQRYRDDGNIKGRWNDWDRGEYGDGEQQQQQWRGGRGRHDDPRMRPRGPFRPPMRGGHPPSWRGNRGGRWGRGGY